MSFKLLAIRPLEGCNPRFLKNLEENRIYQFYNDYKFIKDNEGHVNSIKYNETVPKELYYQGERYLKTKINISAIVGKNGSGKSALIELLVASILKISLDIKENFINKDSFEEEIYFESIDKSIQEDLQNINTEIYFLHNCLPCNFQNNDLECFSTAENPVKEKIKIRKIKIIDSKIDEIIDYEEFETNIFEQKVIITRQDLKFGDLENQLNIHREEFHFLQDFFYTMIINYSHYGFNANETGDWLNGVFHKNDGYQLPVVIHPYREDGNIDVNREKELTSSRFLVNILQEKKLRTISKGKPLSHIKIILNQEKIKLSNISIGHKTKKILAKK